MKLRGRARKTAKPAFSEEKLHDHLMQLYRISCAAGELDSGVRLNAAGEAVADYLQDHLQKAGVSRVRRQYFTADRWWPERYSLCLLADGGEEPLRAFPLWYAKGIEPTVVEVVDIGFGTSGELRGKKVRGRAVLLRMRRIFHFIPTFEKIGIMAKLVRMGAAAVIIMDALLETPGGILAISHREVMNCGGHGIPLFPLPAVSIGRTEGLLLVDKMAAGRVRVKIHLSTSMAAVRACNIIAEVDGNGRSEEVILVGGHYDSWFGGALDNLASQGGIIELARHFASLPLEQRPRKLIFACIFGHEFGNLGHMALARELREIKDRITCFLDLDGSGSTGWEVDHDGNIVETGYNDVCGIVCSSNALAKLAYQALYEQDIFSFRFTDNAHIADLDGPLSELGIPTLLIISKHLFYHTPLDTPDRIPPELLLRRMAVNAQVLSNLLDSRPGYYIATNTNPFREEGPGSPRLPDLEQGELPVNPRPWVDGPPKDLLFEVIPPSPRVCSPVMVWKGHSVGEGIGRIEDVCWSFGNLAERVSPRSRRGIATGTVYLTPGIKTVRMTVTDRQGRSASVERKIEVKW
jgi:hypothetical protein